MKLDEPVAELLVLLPEGQAAILEESAHAQGLSLGELIRLILRGYLKGLIRPGSVGQPQPPDGVAVGR